MRIAVTIACGAPAAMEGRRAWCEDAGRSRTVTVASSLRRAITEFVRHRPDASLVDLPLLAQDDFSPTATTPALDPATSVVALTDHYCDFRHCAEPEAGIATYALKDMLAENLARVVCSVDRKSDH